MKRRLEQGRPVFGASCSLGSPIVAETLALAGFDYLYFDMQHGLVSFDTLFAMLQAVARSGATPLVRVQRNDSGLIGQVLDAGAEGVIVPMVNTREDAERAAAACRYVPEGNRSWGPFRVALTLGREPEILNREVMCLVMIETAEGVANANEIASTPGVDGVYIGPYDLSLSLGLPAAGGIQPGPQGDAIATIRGACDAAGIICGISGHPIAMTEAGFKLVTIGADASFIQSGAQQVLDLRAPAVEISQAR
jgi:4-hydroxy-2-oxoheptanedioate aldolase